MARADINWDDERCAEHNNEILSFDHLINEKISSLSESHMLFNKKNDYKIITNLNLYKNATAALLDKAKNTIKPNKLNDFSFEKFHHGRTQHAVIFVNGFLSKGAQDDALWLDPLLSHPTYQNSHLYRIHWGSCSPEEMLASLAGAFAIPIPAARLGGPVAKWYTAMLNAEKAGRQLALSIHRFQDWDFTLVGHSLGARVIYTTLQTLARLSTHPYIRNAFLLGGAVDNDESARWDTALNAIKNDTGKIYNGHSDNDEILRKLYQLSLVGSSKPVGLHPIKQNHPKILNVNCSDFISGHNDWKPKLTQALLRFAAQK